MNTRLETIDCSTPDARIIAFKFDLLTAELDLDRFGLHGAISKCHAPLFVNLWTSYKLG